jgi:hypothetical protein
MGTTESEVLKRLASQALISKLTQGIQIATGLWKRTGLDENCRR